MSLKEIIFTRYLTLRNLFVGGNILLLGLLVAAVIKDQNREWKKYQREFFRMEKTRLAEEISRAKTPEEKDVFVKELNLFRGQSVKIRQLMAPALDRYDRCTSCHLGYDPVLSPGTETVYADHPYAAKPHAVHKAHPVERFACSVCHEGQGLATSVDAGHGRVKHWEKPLRTGGSIQSSCTKCHSDLYDETRLPQTPVWRRGEVLFKKLGCIGCHQIHGQGGPISVDLAEETADKPLSRIDFSHTGLPESQRTLANWIRLHFVKDPWELVPGDPTGRFNDEPIAPSGMPFFNLPPEDADAVTTYVLSLSRDKIPMEYRVPVAGPRPEPVLKTAAQRGAAVYTKYGCGGCHAPDGSGGTRNFNYVNVTEPNLRKSVATYTREELIEKIEKGVSPVDKADPKGPTPSLYMPPWKDKIHGQEMEDLVTYLFSIAEKLEEW
ncbi:MAG: c-type cytochrome [Elusimicrobia bacterium]|jgi:predicted CxxxxCH...CXXCH cytochrome family protein|nr:c-type cytochrome [Elusimicrobiota bacterium]